MHSTRNQYIHEISAEEIISILSDGAWKTGNQSITSAITNDNNLPLPDQHYTHLNENTSGPNAFADIHFAASIKRILDVGGGQFDSNQIYLKKKKSINLLVWDPYNRSKEHNVKIQNAINTEKVDAATSMSVLNVIPDLSSRLSHITTVKFAMKLNGNAYFKIWPGDLPLRGSYLPSETADYYQSNAYADRFLREIEVVFGKGNAVISPTVPNLIISKKINDAIPSTEEITSLQKLSKIEIHRFNKQSNQALHQTHAYQLKLLRSTFTLFKKIEESFLYNNRHQDQRVQNEYDKRHGLIIRQS